MQNFNHNIGFEKNAIFFAENLAKIAENCDHNINPRNDHACSSLLEWSII
jgi:hypothetical protein